MKYKDLRQSKTYFNPYSENGRIVGIRRASMVFPAPGAPIIRLSGSQSARNRPDCGQHEEAWVLKPVLPRHILDVLRHRFGDSCLTFFESPMARVLRTANDWNTAADSGLLAGESDLGQEESQESLSFFP